jgi:hypothetical protein
VRASSISNKSIRWVYCAVFVAIAKQYVYYAHDVLAKKNAATVLGSWRRCYAWIGNERETLLRDGNFAE